MLQEPGSYIGEVIKVMGKKKILVKVLSAVFFLLRKSAFFITVFFAFAVHAGG